MKSSHLEEATRLRTDPVNAANDRTVDATD